MSSNLTSSSYASLAQLVEHWSPKPGVGGSSPSGCAQGPMGEWLSPSSAKAVTLVRIQLVPHKESWLRGLKYRTANAEVVTDPPVRIWHSPQIPGWANW